MAPSTVGHRPWVIFLGLLGCAHAGPSPLLTLRRVVLNQSGSGYFERSGRVTGDRLALRLKSHEVDDVLATLTVLEQGPAARQTVVAAGVPHASNNGRDETVNLDLRLPDPRPRNLVVSYAVPTANWQATYRVVLPDREGGPALLQVWALVHNSSDEDWNHVELTLATGAPLSFAFHLRTPSFSSRPDATGAMTTPVVNGPVLSEQTVTRSTMRFASNRTPDNLRAGSGDLWRDEEDARNLEGEHRAGDEVGGRARGREGDRDGAEVRLREAQVRVLQQVVFDVNSRDLSARHQTILSAVAELLRSHPRVRLVELQGNASAEEADPWNLALDRAASVRARLIALGIEAERLRVRSLGTSRPQSPGDSPEARSRNRYVGFNVAASPDPSAAVALTPGRSQISVESLARSAAQNASANEFLGATRYVVSAPVSIASSTAALVTIASREVPGEDVYLFRPEALAPSSREHPYRAARIRNRTGMTLLPGPVALFSGGTFAGEGLLQRLHDDESTFIPYAIDPSTTVTVREARVREALRVISAVRNVVTLEDTEIHHTIYTVNPGAQSPSRIFLRHPHLEGFSSRALPPESEQGPSADLVPVPLTSRQQSTLTLDQTRPAQRSLSLIDDITTDLAPYLQGSSEALRQALRAVLELRNSLSRFDREADELRERLSDTAERNAELRETLRALSQVTDQARVELRARLTRQLSESMTRHQSLSRDLSTRADNSSALRTQLIDALRGLRIEPESGASSGRPDATATH